MQKCLKFHVRFIDLGLFFHVLISPANIWAERLWAEISLNMNKSACVNVIWISAFHLSKCQSRREGIIIGNWVMRPLLFQTNLLLGFIYEGPEIYIYNIFTALILLITCFWSAGVLESSGQQSWEHDRSNNIYTQRRHKNTHNDPLGWSQSPGQAHITPPPSFTSCQIAFECHASDS